jgi:hypothetical protein
MTSVPWGRNDSLFRKEAEEGHKWARLVAERLSALSVPSTTSPLEFAVDEADRERFVNEQDVLLTNASGFIEVKSRRLAFTEEPSSYPFGTAFVDTATGWDKKHPKPLAVVLVSQFTSAMLVVPVSTQSTWAITRSYDRVRQISERWYTVDSDLLRPFAELVEWLKSRPQTKKE